MTLPHSWLTTAREGLRSALRHLRDRAEELAPEEGQQVGVDLILKRGREAVRCARIVRVRLRAGPSAGSGRCWTQRRLTPLRTRVTMSAGVS
jgi:hypothetical protein